MDDLQHLILALPEGFYPVSDSIDKSSRLRLELDKDKGEFYELTYKYTQDAEAPRGSRDFSCLVVYKFNHGEDQHEVLWTHDEKNLIAYMQANLQMAGLS